MPCHCIEIKEGSAMDGGVEDTLETCHPVPTAALHFGPWCGDCREGMQVSRSVLNEV